MKPIPYTDIGLALKNTVNSLDVVKELKKDTNDISYITVVGYGEQPPNNANYIGIGIVNDKGKPKMDTFDSDEREYVFQVSVMFKRLGEYQLEIIEKLTSLFTILLKYAFRMSDEMICNVHERDMHGDIEYDEEDNPIVLFSVDLRDILHITDIVPVFGTPQGDGILMYLKFDVDEDDIEMTNKECFKITQTIKEVLVNVEKKEYQRSFNKLRGYGYKGKD